jgi:DNA ligase-1
LEVHYGQCYQKGREKEVAPFFRQSHRSTSFASIVFTRFLLLVDKQTLFAGSLNLRSSFFVPFCGCNLAGILRIAKAMSPQGKKHQQQSSLTSFFAPKKSGGSSSSTTKVASNKKVNGSNAAQASEKCKENAHNLDDSVATDTHKPTTSSPSPLAGVDEASNSRKKKADTTIIAAAASTTKTLENEKTMFRKKRRVIDDEDDELEEEADDEGKVEVQTSTVESMDTTDDSPTVQVNAPKDKISEEVVPEEEESETMTNNVATKTSRINKSALLKLAPKDMKVQSDDALLADIPDTSWPLEQTSLPYLFLCQALSQIESITARLQIQSILTKLFRQVLLRHPQDLYPLIYLASNSVAPAYECVELGIGDSLLIKAIAEATGTNAVAVKSKYETVGDLGTVAMSFKGKQKTLGGFFKAAPSSNANNKKKTKLTASEVLDVFREIAKTKGNQSQKYKVDQIKKLLVKASSALETKYIIRGLQGKLRIGLAESTVLISLAHALALTMPATVEIPAEKISKGT